MDKHVKSVIRKYKERSKLGKQKYGVTLERTDLSELDWLRHAQEEALDLVLYLERIIHDRELKEKKCSICKGTCWLNEGNSGNIKCFACEGTGEKMQIQNNDDPTWQCQDYW